MEAIGMRRSCISHRWDVQLLPSPRSPEAHVDFFPNICLQKWTVGEVEPSQEKAVTTIICFAAHLALKEEVYKQPAAMKCGFFYSTAKQ